MRLRLFRVHKMAPPSERQKIAEALKNEIHSLGGFVVNPMPLPPGEKLRCQFLAGPACEDALEKLRGLGFEPMFRNAGLRFCLNGTATPCSTFEISIAADTPKVADDRTIRGDAVDRENEVAQKAAIAAMRAAIYGRGK